MAEHASAGSIRRGYTAFNAGDMETIAQILSDDCVWHVPGQSRLAGTYADREATFGYFGKLMELSGGTFRTEIHDVVANDDHVVGLHRVVATSEGRSLAEDVALVFHMREGRVVEVWEVHTDQYAFDEFWS